MKIVKSHKTKTFMVLYILDRDINMGRGQTFYTTFIVYQYYNFIFETAFYTTLWHCESSILKLFSVSKVIEVWPRRLHFSPTL